MLLCVKRLNALGKLSLLYKSHILPDIVIVLFIAVIYNKNKLSYA